ncbi:hypothetical protein EVAR_10061_1 [Eumeta japonica]|uniref:Uncharacterized protein n=1 Tax=Eumeta variegata TaxID=151549 RepID=A0A4C1TR99_EUMVA|nr:hypothetical protein EVAR_10061_1 [Eumeta japonica]
MIPPAPADRTAMQGRRVPAAQSLVATTPRRDASRHSTSCRPPRCVSIKNATRNTNARGAALSPHRPERIDIDHSTDHRETIRKRWLDVFSEARNEWFNSHLTRKFTSPFNRGLDSYPVSTNEKDGPREPAASAPPRSLIYVDRFPLCLESVKRNT